MTEQDISLPCPRVLPGRAAVGLVEAGGTGRPTTHAGEERHKLSHG